MNDDEYIQALERYSQDRECLIPQEFYRKALMRIKDGKEPVVTDAHRNRPLLSDTYDVALRLYKESGN
ncbi:MAG: hypothetical protein HZA80_02030 [Candidatus Taylorbacteria bacterium]|nr:hypothetical protein [Candidatus Taylorbacteria bacterium]